MHVIIGSNHCDFFFLHEKNVRMDGKNLVARLHAIVFIVFQEKLLVVLRHAVRLVD